MAANNIQQRIKNAIGFSEARAFEVYPECSHVVNVANMRHLFIPSQPITIGWYQTEDAGDEE